MVLAVREAPPFERALRAEAWVTGAPRANDPVGSTALRDPARRRLLIVPDPVPGLGPLAGLASGLRAARAPVCVVLAGDLPFVTPAFVDRLGEALPEDDGHDAVVPRVGGRRQPLCAAYRRNVYELAARMLEARPEPDAPSPSMRGFLDRLRVRELAADDLTGVGDLAAITRGIDNPADLAWATLNA